MFAILLDNDRLGWPTGKVRDCSLPEQVGSEIRLHHTNLPAPREMSPNFMCCTGSDSMPTAAAKDKEFRKIPDCCVARKIRTSLHQGQTCQLPACPDQE
jgi:hypothetical protein